MTCNRIIVLVLLSLIWPALLEASGSVATLDDGNLLIYITNDGSYGFDKSASRNTYGGLYYPKNTLNSFMEGAGIWIAGKVDDEWRVTIAGGPSEFVPGPAYSYDTSATEFPIFKVTRGKDYQLNFDYRTWPTTLGAPADLFGRPLIMGSQALYTIFSDTDTLQHRYNISGTLPLGVEVQLYTYTFDNDYQVDDTMLAQVVILEFSIRNVTATAIDSCIVTCYADPDIGYSNNDRIASDSASGSCYCYNENDFDIFYGHNPPTIGIAMLDGALTSVNFYHSRSDYDTVTQSVYLMKGLDLEGNRYVDSTTGLETFYPYNGDPVAQTGWIDTVSHDYRLMLNLAPERLEPGASTHCRMALILSHGGYYLDGITQFRAAAAHLQQLEKQGSAPEIQAAASPASGTGNLLPGRDWGGRFLAGGLDLASRFLGIAPRPDSLPDLRILIGPEHHQVAARYCTDGKVYRFSGKIEAPVDLFDDATLTRYDLAFVDSDCNGLITDASGKLEPLLLTDRPYSESTNFPLLLSEQAADFVAALWLDGSAESLAGAELVVQGNFLQRDFLPLATDLDFGELPLSNSAEQVLMVSNPSRFALQVDVAPDDPLRVTVKPSAFTLGVGDSSYVYVTFGSKDVGLYSGTISLAAYGYTRWQSEIPWSAMADALELRGDLDGDGLLGLPDLIGMIAILYHGRPFILPEMRLDANCDGAFDLTDVILYINSIIYAAETTCR